MEGIRLVTKARVPSSELNPNESTITVKERESDRLEEIVASSKDNSS